MSEIIRLRSIVEGAALLAARAASDGRPEPIRARVEYESERLLIAAQLESSVILQIQVILKHVSDAAAIALKKLIWL